MAFEFGLTREIECARQICGSMRRGPAEVEPADATSFVAMRNLVACFPGSDGRDAMSSQGGSYFNQLVSSRRQGVGGSDGEDPAPCLFASIMPIFSL